MGSLLSAPCFLDNGKLYLAKKDKSKFYREAKFYSAGEVMETRHIGNIRGHVAAPDQGSQTSGDASDTKDSSRCGY